MAIYKKSTIYYMSGTGNTYRAATWACEEFENQNLAYQLTAFDNARPPAEITPEKRTLLGLFLPTHGFTAPWVMIRFTLNLPPGQGTHAFISVTRGGTKIGKTFLPGFEGTAAFLLALILRIKGYQIRGVTAVDMPLNWTAVVPGFSAETAEAMNTRQKPKMMAFIKRILNGEKVFGFWSIFSLVLGLLILPFSLGYLLIARYFLAKLFFPTSDCTGCGSCAKHCPANAIEMRGTDNPRPFWTLSCESCMRCMNYCPENAIEASHLLAVIFFYLASIPAGFILIEWLAGQIPFLSQISGSLVNALLQYGYMVLSFVITYYLFHLIIRIKIVNQFFTYGTLTHYYRRYRQPGVQLKDLE